MGAIVYGTGSGQVARFHKDPNCSYLLKGGPLKHPVQAWDLNELVAPHLCTKCFPDQPRVEVQHPRCTVCIRGTRPCRHNGGVRVTNGRSSFYVWPERAGFYTLAKSGLQS